MRNVIRLMVLILSVLASSVQAQSIATTQGATTNRLLERKIDISLQDVSLQKAIDEIAALGEVHVLYVPEVVGKKAKVSLRASGITVRDAFVQALKGSGLELSMERGQLVIANQTAVTKSQREQGVIAGKITDSKTGRGISGASVSVDAQAHGTMTGEDGAYRLAGISAGVHTVIVRLVGYAKQTRSVTVGEGSTTTMDFRLEPSASVLDQVIVTGTVVSTELKAVPSAMTVITAKQIEERGITRIDQLFRGDIPGLFALNRGSNSALDQVTMFSRGATSLSFSSSGVDQNTGNTNPIKTYVDGVEMADPQYLSQIDPSSIERIEILAGPQASTIYGANAINGVMQIFTKRGNSNKPQLTLNVMSGVAQNNSNSSLAPDQLADVNMSGTEGRVSYNTGGSWNYIGSWTPGKQTQRFGLNGGLRAEFGKFSIDGSARHGVTDTRQDGSTAQGFVDRIESGDSPNSTIVSQSIHQTQSLIGQTSGLSLSYRPFTWWYHEVGIGSDASSTETISAPSYKTPGDTTPFINPLDISRASQRYNTTLQIPVLSIARLSLTAGGDHWRTTGGSWTASPLSLIGNVTPLTNLTPSKPGKNSGAYMQGQLGMWDALFLTYGLRADWNPNYGDEAKVRPGRYGISYVKTLGPVSAKFRGSYGRSIRPPVNGLTAAVPNTNANRRAQFGNFDILLANPDLGPEFQQGGEGGIELYLGSTSFLTVTHYNQTVDNLILFVINVDSVRSLLPVAPSTANCSFNQFNVAVFDAEGHCFRYQNQNLNVGSIRNQGWETQGGINIGPFVTRGTYSWTKSRILGITPKYRSLVVDPLTGTPFQPGRSFDFVPEHTWSLSTTYSRLSSSVSVFINGTGMLYRSNVSGNADELSLATFQSRLTSSRPRMELPGYRVLASGYAMADLNATHRFSSNIDAVLSIKNLTNYYENDFGAGYAAIGRQSKLGLRIRLR